MMIQYNTTGTSARPRPPLRPHASPSIPTQPAQGHGLIATFRLTTTCTPNSLSYPHALFHLDTSPHAPHPTAAGSARLALSSSRATYGLVADLATSGTAASHYRPLRPKRLRPPPPPPRASLTFVPTRTHPFPPPVRPLTHSTFNISAEHPYCRRHGLPCPWLLPGCQGYIVSMSLEPGLVLGRRCPISCSRYRIHAPP